MKDKAELNKKIVNFIVTAMELRDDGVEVSYIINNILTRKTMGQEKIKYSEVMALGFTEEKIEDQVYFDQFGFDYAMIVKPLTEKIYLDWEKETQLAILYRVDNDRNIKAQLPICSLEHMEEIINFFTDKK